jgi:hypothetical protein
MKLIKDNFYRFLLLALVIFSPIISFAQAGNVPDPRCKQQGMICNPISTDNLNDLIKTLLEGVLKIGFPLIALAIIYCGFLFVKAQGNSEELKTAKDALLYTLIGAAILLGSWAIAMLISETVLAL